MGTSWLNKVEINKKIILTYQPFACLFGYSHLSLIWICLLLICHSVFDTVPGLWLRLYLLPWIVCLLSSSMKPLCIWILTCLLLWIPHRILHLTRKQQRLHSSEPHLHIKTRYYRHNENSHEFPSCYWPSDMLYPFVDIPMPWHGKNGTAWKVWWICQKMQGISEAIFNIFLSSTRCVQSRCG